MGEHSRISRVPSGSSVGLRVIASVGIAAAVPAIVLGLTPPAGYTAVSGGVYVAIVAVGVIVLALPAQLLHRYRRPQWTDPVTATDDAETADQ